MFDGVDIKKELIKVKSDINLLNSVNELLDNDIVKESVIEENITKSISKNYSAEINTLSKEDIFNIEAIKKIAIQHRLRFLPTKYFKNEIPKEAIFKIKEIEKANNLTVEHFFILAPSQAFDLEDCNKDPLLFIPLKNKNYLLVHQWGDDLGWIKKAMALPLQTIESMFVTVGITAFLIAAFTPTWLILNGAEVDMGYFGYHRIAWFLYSFIMLCSLSTFMCFSQNIYPSEYQWDKKTYN
tara:strand:- start:4610 stop:5329 length:720 start_codon:yes stop_codon:yes gene_type:complete